MSADRDVILAILEGSAMACRELHGRYRGRVFALIDHLVHDPDLAEDLTQETLTKAFLDLASFDTDRPFWPWIRTIAKHKIVDHYRLKKRDAKAVQGWLDETTAGRRLKEGVPAIDQTPSGAHSLRRFRAYQKALALLKEPYHTLYVLRAIHKRSYDDIAKSLRVPAGTVRSYVHRARRQLQAMIPLLLEESPSPA